MQQFQQFLQIVQSLRRCYGPGSGFEAASLEIQMSAHDSGMMTKEVFALVAQACGTLVEIDWFTSAGPSLGSLRMKVRLVPSWKISDCILLKVDDNYFNVSFHVEQGNFAAPMHSSISSASTSSAASSHASSVTVATCLVPEKALPCADERTSSHGDLMAPLLENKIQRLDDVADPLRRSPSIEDDLLDVVSLEKERRSKMDAPFDNSRPLNQNLQLVVFRPPSIFPLPGNCSLLLDVLSVTDSFVSINPIPARHAYIGLAAAAGEGSWQIESKGYQFWVQTDSSGEFIINNVIPGTYSLHGWASGFIGDYYDKGPITISSGSTKELGNLTYIPPRHGPTQWEIGFPDQTAVGSYVPDPNPLYVNKLYLHSTERYRQYGLWDRYTDMHPTSDQVYMGDCTGAAYPGIQLLCGMSRYGPPDVNVHAGLKKHVAKVEK
ncbi:hypothetical protein AMTR_s00037p00211780 [Amborella trichopoda]|uniref:Rhamnogalacturonan lyase domain-containing protein n=1 Tax=Amborella trichopoda TaxID=13333 RepID=U5D7K5_AMBTC|nr:hypothetical protein AMTR_s00037p00211780 [Amborella trichopoda]